MSSKRVPACGTNFYSVYQCMPELYHEFSTAEDSTGILAQRLRERCDPLRTRLLDIGAGTGKLAGFLAPHCRNVIALEPSLPFLAFAKCHGPHRPNLCFVRGVAEHLPLCDSTATLIVLAWATFDLENGIPEILRVLAPGGTAVRFGAWESDALTQLFPQPSFDLFKTNAKFFEARGFQTELLDITIDFGQVGKARKVLGRILGSPAALRVSSSRFRHRVAFQTLAKA